jgi:hypothetical protein
MAADIDKALFYQVSHDSGVIALMSTRFYPIAIPQTTTFPLALYQMVSGVPVKVHDGKTILPKPRYQITVWAITFAEVVAIDLSIKLAIDGKRGNWGTGSYITYIESSLAETTPRDDRDPVTGLYQRSRDYNIMYSE